MAVAVGAMPMVGAMPAAMSMAVDTPPNQTIYVHNLFEKLPKDGESREAESVREKKRRGVAPPPAKKTTRPSAADQNTSPPQTKQKQSSSAACTPCSPSSARSSTW